MLHGTPKRKGERKETPKGTPKPGHPKGGARVGEACTSTTQRATEIFLLGTPATLATSHSVGSGRLL